MDQTPVRNRPGPGIFAFVEKAGSISNAFERLSKAVSAGEKVISVSGLSSTAAKSFVLARLIAETGVPMMVVTDLNIELEAWESDISFWDPSLRVFPFPAFEADIYSGVSPHAETLEKRALALWSLANGEADIIVAAARGTMTKTVAPERILALGASLKRDSEIDPDELIENLASAGYRREDPIANIGEFSMRGGIVDVWAPGSDFPFRIEFFGDVVDSIRTFDSESQLSVEQVKAASIPPMREFGLDPEELREWAEAAGERFPDEKFARGLKDRTEFAQEGETFPGWEFLVPLVDPRSSSVFDYLNDFVLVADEPAQIERSLASYYETLETHLDEALAHGEIGLGIEELFLLPEMLRETVNGSNRVELRSLGRTAAKTDEEFSMALSGAEPEGSLFPHPKPNRPLFLFPLAEDAEEFEIQSRSSRRYSGDIKKLVSETGGDLSRTEFVFRTAGMAERFSDVLRDYDIVIPHSAVRLGKLSSGFEIPSIGARFTAESEIFGDTDLPAMPSVSRAPERKGPRTSAFISDFRDLKQGDYVVHVDHGIGRFEGLETIGTQGVEREFMLLVYDDDAKLFVPVERLDLVSRYSSGEAAHPSLDRLGGLGWQKTKARAKRAMRDMADELLRLYAERKLVRGYAFAKDAPWQSEMEDAFPYQLTPDQKTSIAEVKKDMETATPMDRLIVGDVGYGKTEVAMRAAFKAVMDGKQVAVLTPTTVLSYQHFETFKQRFAAFPVRVELLSRFRTRKEQKDVVERNEKGEVDILIGTHRILSNDVKFPNLGLVVVDEEQRFGVAHKEKLKHLRKRVDVLTLSATPIPRTLNMSLTGMRDLSIIETPPRDRLAINTQVLQFSEGVIKSAIELELSRSGQIFFIHNRVETIEAIAAHIQKIVPEARVVIGHGQMGEKDLENVMLDFIDYKYDVLVATTIIENGIDIPRANTIIINRADNYGLSQLYQLRGRVGRSNRRAYAYLLIPSELELTPIARQRLSAIREFSDLGAGFRIAALDLELRGAGNILGGEQSGHLDALGFDLYTKMLNRTIQELRGDEIEDEVSVSINLGVDVSIPVNYISDTSQRLRTYKRISSAEDEEELHRIYLEMQDRYGRLRPSVDALFEYARLRRKAERMHVISIDKAKEGIAVKLGEKSKVDPERLMALIESTEGAAFSPNGILRVPLDSGADPIGRAREVLERVG
ncbi:MAG TPA: transcription-repair coupling factor [Aridibacter sp.]|nr:transcription-repair coupling factor [Aridibacter sp.]